MLLYRCNHYDIRPYDLYNTCLFVCYDVCLFYFLCGVFVCVWLFTCLFVCLFKLALFSPFLFLFVVFIVRKASWQSLSCLGHPSGLCFVQYLFCLVYNCSSPLICTFLSFFPLVIIMWCVLPKTDTFGQEIKTELVIDNESRDLQLYNDSFLILIGHAKAGLSKVLSLSLRKLKTELLPFKVTSFIWYNLSN